MPPRKPPPTKTGAPENIQTFAFDHGESMLVWTLIGQMYLLGRARGVNFEVMKAAVLSSTADAARQRWDGLRNRMKTMGLPLPEPAATKVQPKANKAGTKEVVKVEQEEENEENAKDDMEGTVSKKEVKITKAKGKGKPKSMAKCKSKKITKEAKNGKAVSPESDEEESNVPTQEEHHSIIIGEENADSEYDDIDEDVA